MRSRKLGILAVAAVMGLTAACSANKESATVSKPGAAGVIPSAPFAGEGIGNNAIPGTSSVPPQPCGKEATSATWSGELPSEGGTIPSGGKVATIRDRGFLVAGIDLNTVAFGWDPQHTNNPQGFDVDIARQVAKAIFGDADPKHIKFRVVTLTGKDNGEYAQLRAGNVDLVVRTTTITCARLQNLNFSNPYYIANQALLLPLGPDGKKQHLSLADLKGTGKKVCATDKSTAYDTIVATVGRDQAYGATNGLDCLALLQQDKVDGVFTDDAILRGMEKQDPHVAVTDAPVSEKDAQPYGIVTDRDPGDPTGNDLSPFVNSVLAKMIADGTWRSLFANDLGSPVPSPPVPPASYPLGS